MIKDKQAIKNANTFCLFVGYPRSSHTLIGAILDAHPEILISTEANAIRMFQRGYPTSIILGKLVAKSKWFAQNGAFWTGYSYKVPNQYQGKFTKLKIIGDKKGEQTTAIVRKYKDGIETLNNLDKQLDKKIKLIHVIRNPFDNITTLARKGGDSVVREVTDEIFEESIKRYFLEVAAVQRIKDEIKHPMFDLRNEDLINDTNKTLKALCKFLEIDAGEDYLNSCSSIVLSKQKRTRDSIKWTSSFKKKVEKQVAKYDFLKSYTFDN